jgi:hypothetical protein
MFSLFGDDLGDELISAPKYGSHDMSAVAPKQTFTSLTGMSAKCHERKCTVWWRDEEA